MYAYREAPDGGFTIFDGAKYVSPDGVQYPGIIINTWTDPDLAEIGLYRVLDSVIPPDKISIGFSLDWDEAASVVRRTHTLEPKPAVFPTLTRKQLRNGLLSIGVTSADVEVQIGTIADPLERAAALIDWQDTQAYERTNPLVNQIGVAMGLPKEQIDALWMWAAGI